MWAAAVGALADILVLVLGDTPASAFGVGALACVVTFVAAGAAFQRRSP
jgi:hypothetical protein